MCNSSVSSCSLYCEGRLQHWGGALSTPEELWSQPCTISPEPIQTRPEVWSSQLTDREQHLAWWPLLLQSLQRLSQYALLLWPYRKDQEEFTLRNRDDSVNDASRNSDGMVNPGQEITNKKRHVLILAEVKQKKSRHLCQYSYFGKAVPIVLVQKLVSCTNKLKSKTKVTASIQNHMAYSRSIAYNLSHIFLHLVCLKSKINISL